MSPDDAPKAQTEGVRVDVVVVTYNSEDSIVQCLDSVQNLSVETNLIVVDNGSVDETVLVLNDYAARHSNVRFLRSPGNVGLAAGNNAALPYLNSDFTLILNPDCRLNPGALEGMIAKMQREPDIAAVGPLSTFEDGKPHSSFHARWGYWHVVMWRFIPYKIIRKLYDIFRQYKEADVDFVSGACLLTKTEIFKSIGGYDPEYFLTVEDVCDLCRRARHGGKRIVFYPGVNVIHIAGVSGRRVPYVVSIAAAVGTLYHFSKYHGRFGAFLVFSIIISGLALKALLSGVKYLVRWNAIALHNVKINTKVLTKFWSVGPFYYFKDVGSFDGSSSTRTSRVVLS